MPMFTYRGRVVTDKDIIFIKELIAQNPDASRWVVSSENQIRSVWLYHYELGYYGQRVVASGQWNQA